MAQYADVDAANIALSILGDVGAITALDQQGSDPARRISLHYGPAYEVALARHDWGFARRYFPPAVVATQYTTPAIPVPFWAYAYAYPTKMLAIRFVVPPAYNPSRPDPSLRVPYERGHWVSSATEEKPVIYTNLAAAIVAYTYRVDEAFLPSSFIEYFAAELALRVVVPLGKAKPAIVRSVEAILTRAWDVATLIDVRQQQNSADDFLPESVKARM